MLGKLSVPGRPTSLDDSRARAYCACNNAGGGCLDIFSLIYLFSFLSPSLWETARYRLKYCLKGPLNLKQPTKIFSKTFPRRVVNNLFATSFSSCIFVIQIDTLYATLNGRCNHVATVTSHFDAQHRYEILIHRTDIQRWIKIESTLI